MGSPYWEMKGKVVIKKMIEEGNRSEIKGTVTCDIWEALRKFANENIMLITKTLYAEGSLTLGDIRDKTGISTNILNHNLIEMRRVDLVKKVGSKYCLTKYGAVLFEGLGEVLNKIYPIPSEALLEPQEQGVLV
jgi:DNA-binding HxlR family transcriptional regulator